MSNIIFTVINDLTYDRRMQRICGSLARAGYDVTLIGRQLKDSKPLKQADFKQERIRCFFNQGKFFYLEYNLRLFFLLLFKKADIYSAVDLDTIMPNFLVAGIKGKKRCYDAHEYFHEVPEVVERKAVQGIWAWVAKTFIPKSDLAYTVSESLAEELSNQYDTQFHTIRNVPYLEEGIVKDEPGKYLLYQGALNEGRGLEELIEAMQQVDFPLKVVGEGDLSQTLRQKVEALGLDSKIEFLGFVEPEKLPAITAGAYLGLNLLQKKGLSYYYSLANKFFDYINSGVPSISMNFPEYQRVDEQFKVSVLLDSLEPHIISEKINELLADNHTYNHLKDECFRARKALNWEKEEQILLKLHSRFGK